MYNKKCRYNYSLLESFTAGIILNGPEVKALREDKVSFGDSFCHITNGEMFLRKLHISVKDGSEGECMRDRKLLLNKKEISKIGRALKEKGLTIVPVSIFFNKTGLVKVEIFLAKGKKQYDKRSKEKYSSVKLALEND